MSIIILFIIVNIIFDILLFRNNNRLHNQVRLLYETFETRVHRLEEERDEINIKLNKIIDLVNNNDMVDDIIKIMDSPDKCKYHNDVYRHMKEYQYNIEKEINDLINNKDE